MPDRERTDDPSKARVRVSDDALRPQLPKRFFKAADVEQSDDGWRVVLDGRPLRTPKRAELIMPSRTLAEAMAAEWNALGDVIDPARLPLTKIANTAIDGVCGREREVHDDIVRYIGNDLLCYRAEAPQELVTRQAAAWDPVLAWIEETFGATLKVTQGIMPVEQNIVAVAKVASGLADEDALSLAPLHVMTTLTGSAVLTIAHLKGRLSAEAVWQATHVDEDWQIEQWGEDAEASERRAKRWAEMQSAALFLRLVRA